MPGKWVPHKGVQEEFCKRTEYEVLFGGAAGPGKTDTLVIEASRHTDTPGYRSILMRRTFPQLQEILDRCWKYYPSMGGYYRATEKRWYFPGGDATRANKPFVQLGHMQHADSRYDYQGKEFDFAGFDELTQFLEEQYLYIAGSRVRSVHEHIPSTVRATTNPGGIGHLWVKERFIDPMSPGRPFIDPASGLSRVFIPATLYDNPTLVRNDPGYVARLQVLPEVERKRLLDGDWEVFAGQVFSELSYAVHACDDFEIPHDWERWQVLDWGYKKPFSVGWYAMDFEGVIYRYREWYGCEDGYSDVGVEMVAEEVAKGILERENETIRVRIADTSIFHKIPEFRKHETTGPNIAADFRKAGVHFLQADRDRFQGKQQVHARFKLDDDIDKSTGEVIAERPRVQIFKSCEHFWRTLPMLQADPRRPEDVDTDLEDHIYDEFRYSCQHRPLKPKKQTQTPSGSFQAERQRLIRSRKYAKSHGVSMAVAYERMRRR